MKYIQNPAPVEVLKDRLTYSLPQLVECVADGAPELQSPASAARAAQRLLEAVEKADSEGWWSCEDNDWKLLRDVLEKATTKPSLQMARQGKDGQVEFVTEPIPTRKLIPLIDAVDEARNTRPAKPRAKSEKK